MLTITIISNRDNDAKNSDDNELSLGGELSSTRGLQQRIGSIFFVWTKHYPFCTVT